MSTELVDVLPSWTIQSTSSPTINHISTPVSSTSAIIQQSSSLPNDGLSNATTVRKHCNNDVSNGKGNNTVGEIDNTNSINNTDESQHMTPRSPTTSSTSLPPLPDLIPIRKSNVNHQPPSSSTTVAVAAKKLSTITAVSVKSPVESPCQIDEVNSDSGTLSSHNLCNISEDRTSPAQEFTEADEDIDELQHQHSSTVNQTQTELAAEDYEKEQIESTTVTETSVGEINATPAISSPTVGTGDSKETMAPATIMPQDNQSVAILEQQDAQKKRGRPKGAAVGRIFDNSKIVQHRKSDRRRVERDIFFLFEEHPSNRRRTKKGKKRGPGRPRTRMTDTSTSKLPSQPQPPSSVPPATSPIKKQIPPVKISKEEIPQPTTPSTENLVPRVNPIFLWVKQDDTRIVEVRCEDYDKRNRIRLTRTPNGWRSIPRTDTSSSRVVKLVPNPLVRVKQELQVRPDLLENANTNGNVVGDLVKRIKKSKKKKKRKKKKRKHSSDQEDDSDDDVRKLLSPSPKDVIVYESTNHERDEEQVEDRTTPALPAMDLTSEPNNNEMTADLTKNLTQISDDIELMPFMHHLQNESSMMTLCPQTGVFQPVAQANQSGTVPSGSEHVLSTGFDPCHDVDSKHLKDLLDDADLLQHGAELIDSLVKRGCEDNHISEDEGGHPHQNHLHNPPNHVNGHPKNSMCLSNDFENEEDDILMQPEPVEDIISRLGESLAASPKCLSFNEVGEIEGLHGELFQTSTQQDPFNRTALEELSITIKDLEKSSETFVHPQKTICDTNQRTVESTTNIVSPDSCVDELPKDLTCKKGSEGVLKPQQPPSQLHVERSQSRSSDAIQSPQPSGLPAVPPSPDLMHSKNKSLFLDQLLNNSSASPKICSSVTVTPIKVTTPSQQQKEPLDLGKHRKSASPTVSCSEEAKRSQPITSLNESVSSDEPLQKKIKTEPEIERKSPSEDFMESISLGKDPDPLTQLRLLISNPEWKVPDPILVPKDRLSAVLASPAREIPHLLTTRPELRLPDAFAYPSILQDPDILVIPLAQLETILQKQLEVTKPKASPIPQVTIEAVSKKRMEKPSLPHPEISPVKKTPTKSLLSPMAPLLPSGLANDIDAATFAAFNQMLWLPYLGQMAPEIFKAMAGLPNSANLAEILPFLAQQQQQSQQQQQQSQRQQFTSQFNSAAVPNPMAFQNPLEIAMLQGALNQAQMQRVLKMGAVAQQQRDQIKKHPSETKFSANRNNFNMGPLFAQKNAENLRLPPQQHQSQQAQPKGRSTIGVNPFRQEQNRSQLRQCPTDKSSNMRQMNPYYPPHTGMEISAVRKPKQSPSPHTQTEQKPRVTCKSLSNLLQPERLMQENKMSNLMAMPQFDFNQLHGHQPQHQQNQLPTHLHSQTQGSHQSHYSNHSNLPNPSVGGGNAGSTTTSSNTNNSSSGQTTVGKLKVKPAPHLLDPAAMQRRLLNYDEIPEVGSTTNGMDDIMNDPNAHLWHPLFGSTQKTGYTSPWQWTTVTATGE